MRIQYFKRNKYSNKRCRCNQDHFHDSIGEAAYCNLLGILKKGGQIKDYETQKTFDLKVNGTTICRHRVDFLVTNNNGNVEVREYKGGRITETAVWNIKRKLFEACYPDIPYIVIRG